jgi:4-diphosphocytidyl-2-C-methyl-D-erythritol kinase
VEVGTSTPPWDGASGTDLSWSAVTERARNDFESVVASRHPMVQASLEGLRAEGASLSMLSGSGSAAFGVFPGRSESEEAALALSRKMGWPFRAVRSLRGAPEVRVLSSRG